MHELRLLNPDGYLALHPQARTVVPAEETAAARHHLMTTVAAADAAAPYNQGAGYQPYAYRVQTTPLPEESRMAELHFQPVDPADEPADVDLDDGGCNCDKPDDRYVMEIEEGRVNLTHAACGKSPNWGDWQDMVFASAMPVRVEYDSDCSGSHMHSYTFGCDCDYWFQITEVMGTTVGAEEATRALPSEWDCANGTAEDEPFCAEAEDATHVCPTVRVHPDDADKFAAMVDMTHELQKRVAELEAARTTAEHGAVRAAAAWQKAEAGKTAPAAS